MNKYKYYFGDNVDKIIKTVDNFCSSISWVFRYYVDLVFIRLYKYGKWFLNLFRVNIKSHTYIDKRNYYEVVSIEINNLNKDGLGLLKNMPKSVLSKINISHSFLTNNKDSEIEVTIILGSTPNEISQVVNSLGGKYTDLGYGYGIVLIPIENIVALATSPQIQYMELPKSLYTTDYESNRASCITQISPENNLRGQGILIGFIDTGIDYTHPAFRNTDGTTRIEYIYDLYEGGKIYNRSQINEALKSANPYSIVSSTDVTGHGTHVAGIACAGGNIDSKYYGVAPESSIAMVKTMSFPLFPGSTNS